MKRISVVTFVLVCLSMLLPLAGIAAQNLPVSVVARISVQLPVQHQDDLKKLIAAFAAKHGFSPPESATMPRNRKIFLPAGGFSMMFRAPAEDYYLFMQNVPGQNCVLIDLYAPNADAKYQKLLDELGQSVQQQFGQDAKLFNGSACEGAMSR